MAFRGPFVLLVLFFNLSACTHLDAIRIDSSESVKTVVADNTIKGVPYNLSFTQFEGKVIRRLNSCEINDGKTPALFEVSAVLNTREVRDPHRSYIIPFDTLQSFFKTTDFKIAYYDNGVIKSINANVEDRTGEFVGGLATTIGTLTPMLRPLPSNLFSTKAMVPPREGGPAYECTKAAKDALAALDGKTLSTAIDAATDRLRNVTDDLTALMASVNATGKFGPGTDIRAEVKTHYENVRKAQKELTDLAEKQKRNLDFLTDTNDVRWPSDGETLKSKKAEISGIPAETLAKWFVLKDPNATEKLEQLVPDTSVWLKIESTDVLARDATMTCLDTGTGAVACPEDEVSLAKQRGNPGEFAENKSKKGLKVRMPSDGWVEACLGGTLICTKAKEGNKPVRISQLGRIYTLPLNSYPFTNRTVEATFSEAGQPTQLGIKSSAGSDKLGATMLTTGTAMAAMDKYLGGRDVAALEEQVKVLKLQKELQDAQKALIPVPEPVTDPRVAATSDLNLSTAWLKAQIQFRKAEEKLSTLEGKSKD